MTNRYYIISEEKEILSGGVLTTSYPVLNDEILSDLEIVEVSPTPNTILPASTVAVINTLVTGFPLEHVGKKVKFSYAYGTVSQQFQSYVSSELEDKYDKVGGTIYGDIIPDNNSRKLGSNSQKFSDLYIDGNIKIGDYTIDVNQSTGKITTDNGATTTTFLTSGDTEVFSPADKLKLDSIEVGATTDQTASEIKVAYESNANTNAFTDTEKTKLAGIEANATGDQTASEIKIAYESNLDTNSFSDAYKSKLDGIDALAEVNNISDVNATDLTDGGDSSLHYHSSDRNRANHTGTQLAATISDFNSAVSANSDISLNTAHRTSTGADHTYINQDVTTTATPTFSQVLVGSDPTLPLHLTTKQYVDALSSGLDPKGSVKVASQSNLGGSYSAGVISGINTSTIDGIALGLNERVLVWKQTDPKQNGLYYVTTLNPTTGVLTRATDHDGTPANEVSGGNTVFVEGGTSAGKTYVLKGIGNLSLDVDNLVWELLSSAQDWAWGTGLTAVGNTINITASPTITLNGDVSGSGTLTNLGSTTITTTVADNSHNHLWANITDKPDPVITLTGAITGSGTMTDLNSVSIATTVNHSHDWSTITNKPDPTITLGTHLIGSVTLTDLTSGTLNATINHNLSAINDVSSTAPTLNQVLTWNGSNWAPGTVNINGGNADLLDGQDGTYYLNYNNFTNTPTIPTTLNSLSDVNTTGAINGSVLKYNGSSWVIGTDNAGSSDAATLNGQPGSYYLNASNINAGTINDLYLPATISSNITGNAATATQLQTARTIALSGDVSAPATSFNGTANITLTTTVADNSHNHLWANITDKPDPTITLGNHLTGNVTLTDLGSGTLNATINTGINSLTDVNTTGAISGSVLKYDGANWVVGTDNTGTGSSSSGAAGEIQLSDGAGGFTTSASLVTIVGTTLNIGTLDVAETFLSAVTSNYVISNTGNIYYNIDSDNNSSSSTFVWGTNRSSNTGGTTLMTLSEAGLLTMSSNRIANVSDPILDQDVATKAYVDASVGGGGGIITGTQSNVLQIYSGYIVSSASPGGGTSVASLPDGWTTFYDAVGSSWSQSIRLTHNLNTIYYSIVITPAGEVWDDTTVTIVNRGLNFVEFRIIDSTGTRRNPGYHFTLTELAKAHTAV